MDTTVCILTSGSGSRLKKYTKNKNKSLLSINKESVLTKIFKNFPKKTKFIVSTGYKSKQVENFVQIHHPELNVKFVKIKNYNGANSGPAFSLYKCKKYLQTPFFFVSCDTLWKKKIYDFKSFNWMGSYNPKNLNSADYCNLITKNNDIIKIVDKKKIKINKNRSIFVGLAFIKDYKIFWDGFQSFSNKEPQVSMGFKRIINDKKKIKKIDMDWEDTGTKNKYEKLIIKYEKYNFNKDNQQIYISKSRVTKFFNEKKMINSLFYKAKMKKNIFPSGLKIKNNFISYDYVKGKTLYNMYNVKSFKNLLKFLESSLWNDEFKKSISFYKNCKKFYYYKTHERLKMFLKKNPSLDQGNYSFKNLKLKGVNYLLKKIDWSIFYNGVPKFIHGDLQFDNIIGISKKRFKLLDWRPTFGDSKTIGDQYYDFAKLLGGLEINYDLVKKNKFRYNINKNKILLKIPTRKNSVKLINFFEKYLEKNNYDLKKVKILTGLIFLNMSPLHHEPFDKLLFFYGKYYLQKNLN